MTDRLEENLTNKLKDHMNDAIHRLRSCSYNNNNHHHHNSNKTKDNVYTVIMEQLLQDLTRFT